MRTLPLEVGEEGSVSSPYPLGYRVEEAITRALDDLVDIGYYSFEDDSIIVLDETRPYYYY